MSTAKPTPSSAGPLQRAVSPFLAGVAILLSLAGLFQLVGGIWLGAMGGSWFYAIAGVVLLGVALLLWRRRGAALALYAALLLGTAAWALWEVGPAIWLLMPRLLVPLVFGLLIGLPWVWRRLDGGMKRPGAAVLSVWAAVLLTVIVGGFAAFQDTALHGTWQGREDAAAASDPAVPDGDWHFYGGTPRGDRYSPLAEITPQNVGRLQQAWVARTGDLMQPGEKQGRHRRWP